MTQAYDEIIDSVHKSSQCENTGVLVVAQQRAPMHFGIKDKQFGPALMFGLKWNFVEVLKDVSFGLVDSKGRIGNDQRDKGI